MNVEKDKVKKIKIYFNFKINLKPIFNLVSLGKTKNKRLIKLLYIKDIMF